MLSLTLIDYWVCQLAVAASMAALAIWKLSPRSLGGMLLGSVRVSKGITPAKKDGPEKSPYSDIIPLSDFNLQKAEPVRLRPFKPKFYLTMGKILALCCGILLTWNPFYFRGSLTNITISELVDIDNTYAARLALRRQIMHDHRDLALQAAPAVKPAVDEFYSWMMSTYLPTRFPTLFALTATSLRNITTSELIPLTPPSDPLAALEIIGGNVDGDFLLLLPSEDGDSYELKGLVVCFMNGFNTKEKFGMKLRDIHRPVPGYTEKLEKSMDRFFDKIEVGRVVLRTNWAINTSDRLFLPTGSGIYEGDEVVQDEDVDVRNSYLRSERQTLHRLPQTKAIVFAFKSFLYPLKDIKDQGYGEALADAIDGLRKGSVPAMNVYKGAERWGEAVKEYLRA